MRMDTADAPTAPTIALARHDWQRIGGRFQLSSRELEVVQHVFQGHAEARIAFLLRLSPHTVHTYVRRVYAKLDVCDRAEMILRVFAAYLSPE